MKPKRILLSLAMVTLFGAMLPRQAEAHVSLSFFYNNLDSSGEWIDAGDYGYCWRPTGMDPDWRPYTDGYWAYTDAGWTWVSYEDFGWITYHYGRWTDIDDVGWVWVPGYQWGPAWVSWRSNDNYIGWAPLPPEARFNFSVGFSSWVDRNYDIGPQCYSFCNVRNFGDPVMANAIVPPAQNVAIINNTTNITNITVNNINNSRVVYNGGPDYNTVARRSARPIQALRLQRETNIAPIAGHRLAARTVGNELVVPAPHVERPAKPIAPPKVAKVIKQPKIEHGWAGTSPEQRQQIQRKIKLETKGRTPQSAPARPVNPQKLAAILPAKANPHGTPGGFRKAGEAAAQQPHAPGAPQAGVAGAQTPAYGRKGKHLAPVVPETAGQPGAGQVPGAAQGSKKQQAEAAAEAHRQRQAERQQAAEATAAQRQQQAAAARKQRQAEAQQHAGQAAQARQEQQAEARQQHQEQLQQQRAAEAAQARQERQAEARAQHQAEMRQERAAEQAQARQQQQAEARAQRQAEMQQERAAEQAQARQQQRAEARAQRQAEMQQERAAEQAQARQQQRAEARAQRQAEMQQQRAAQARQMQAERARQQQGGRGQRGQGEDPRNRKGDQNQ